MRVIYVDNHGVVDPSGALGKACAEAMFLESWQPTSSPEEIDEIVKASAPYTPPHPDDPDRGACSICSKQIHTKPLEQSVDLDAYQGFLSDQDAKLTASTLVASIRTNQDYLRLQLPSRCGSLMNKWLTNADSRSAYLKKLNELPKTPFPSIEAVTSSKNRAQLSAMRISFLTPYLCRPNLVEDGSLLLKLLYHRVFMSPSAWVAYDNSLINPPWACGYFEEGLAAGCINLIGEHNYGEWQRSTSRVIHSGTAYYTPRAMLILEAQDFIFRFLRRLLDEVTGSYDSMAVKITNGDAEGMSAFSRNLSKLSGLIFKEKDAELDTILCGRTHKEQPFSAPPLIDLSTMRELCHNQATEVQDEFWLLQTDLDFFSASVRYRRDHHVRKRNDPRASHPNWDWHTVADDLTYQMIERYAYTRFLLEEIDLAIEVMVEDKPRDWVTGAGTGREIILSGVHRLASANQQNYVNELQVLVQQSSSFEKHYRIPRHKEYRLDGPCLILRKDPNAIFKEDPLFWCLHRMWCKLLYPMETKIPSISVLLQFLDTLLAQRINHRRISDAMLRILSLISASSRMIEDLEMHRPHITRVPLAVVNQDRDPWSYHRTLRSDSVQEIIENRSVEEIGLCVKAVEKPGGARNELWLKGRDAGYTALNTLWQKAREVYTRRKTRHGLAPLLIQNILKEANYGERQEQRDRLEQERRDILEKLKRNQEEVVEAEKQVKEFIPIPTGVSSTKIKKIPTGKSRHKPEQKARQTPPTLALAATILDTANSNTLPVSTQSVPDTLPNPSRPIFTFSPTDPI